MGGVNCRRMVTLACAAVLATAGASLQAQDRSTPEATVRSFMRALSAGDIQAATACVAGAKPGPALTKLGGDIKKDPAGIVVSSARATTSGATARVVASGRISPKRNPGQTFAFRSTVKLRRSGGAWQIVPPGPEILKRDPTGGSVDWVNALAAIFAHPDALTGPAGAAQATSCLSNLKQIGMGMLMLAQGKQETFALKPDDWVASLKPYIKNDKLFHCPGDKPGAISYSFNADLAGVAIAKVTSPAETVLAYEGRGQKLEFRHDGRAGVVFADGHARMVTAADAARLRWKP